MIKRVKTFRDSLHELFHSRGNLQDMRKALEADAILNNLNYYCLFQSLLHSGEKVFEYRADSHNPINFDYRGRELFPSEATKLYEERKQTAFDMTNSVLSYELWYIPDHGFAVTTCFRVNVGDGAYTTEYRVHKGFDWTETDMSIDFSALAMRLRDMCNPVVQHQYPIYDL